MKPLLLCLALLALHFHLQAQIETNLKEIEIKAVKSTVNNNSDKLVYNVVTSVTAMGSDALNALSKVPGTSNLFPQHRFPE